MGVCSLRVKFNRLGTVTEELVYRSCFWQTRLRNGKCFFFFQKSELCCALDVRMFFFWCVAVRLLTLASRILLYRLRLSFNLKSSLICHFPTISLFFIFLFFFWCETPPNQSVDGFHGHRQQPRQRGSICHVVRGIPVMSGFPRSGLTK